MSYTDTSGKSETYNAGAAHDSGFYDPDRHDNEIVAVFQDLAAAGAARDTLVGAGVPDDQVHVLDHVAGDAAKGMSESEDKAIGDQILTAFTNLFSSHDDSHDLTHAVTQGHAMVVVTPMGDTDRHQVIHLLEQSGPIDFDAKLAEWRQAGYDNSGAARSPQHDARPTQRETLPARPEGQGRVRSYIADRNSPAANLSGQSAEGTGTGDGSSMGTGGTTPNATPGAGSSGTNSPRG